MTAAALALLPGPSACGMASGSGSIQSPGDASSSGGGDKLVKAALIKVGPRNVGG